MSFTCNICGGKEFGKFAKRANAQCLKCYSFERTRGLYHIIEKNRLIEVDSRILHIAPEKGLALKIRELASEGNYRPVDKNPSIFHPAIGVEEFDLIKDAPTLLSESFDVILHSHVLEHLPCWPVEVLYHLQRALKPSGIHLFCIPLMRGFSASDFGNITEEERATTYGQVDHFHKFGTRDISATLGTMFNLHKENYRFRLDSSFCERHNINSDEIERTVFMLSKQDWKLK